MHRTNFETCNHLVMNTRILVKNGLLAGKVGEWKQLMDGYIHITTY